MEIFKRLFDRFGPQGWWPGETAFEVSIGAILTQNTSWTNVEKAINNLKERGLLSAHKMLKLPDAELAGLIRPAGYFNIKTRRLKNFLSALCMDFDGDIKAVFNRPLYEAREWLLSISGIGPETADSILLYAGEMPIFVVDAYTFRILARHRVIAGDETYDDVQQIFMGSLKEDVKLFNEYHALIVATGKNFCKKKRPLCQSCPLSFDAPNDYS